MSGKADELRLSVLMGLRRGLSLIRGMRRSLTEDDQQPPHLLQPFIGEAPGFCAYLREERGLREATIDHYSHFLRSFEAYVSRIERSPSPTRRSNKMPSRPPLLTLMPLAVAPRAPKWRQWFGVDIKRK